MLNDRLDRQQSVHSCGVLHGLMSELHLAGLHAGQDQRSCFSQSSQEERSEKGASGIAI